MTGTVRKDGPGVLLRGADGTLYYIPEGVVEEYRLEDAHQPGTREGNDAQATLNKCASVHKIKNALRLRSLVIEKLGEAAPAAEAARGGRTSLSALSELADKSGGGGSSGA